MATDNIARMMALDAAQQGGGGGTSDYDDLTNKPSINGVTLTGAKTAADLGIVSNMQANWTETNPESGGYIWNKPGNPGNGTVTIARNGTQISAFTLNQSSDTYVNISVPDVDTALSPTSTNPVQNKAVQGQLARLLNSGAKNLVKPPHSSDNIPGVTATINSDGSITLNGTCTASTFATYIFGAPLLPAGSYRLSGCPSGGSGSTFELSCGGGGLAKVTDYGNSAGFTLQEQTQLTYIQIVARAGAVFNNTTFFPMICTAENYAVSSEFVPYAPTNRELYDMIQALQNG